nr:MAG TPA: hypothetical protein [Caudoviricetes sp.]
MNLHAQEGLSFVRGFFCLSIKKILHRANSEG